MFKLSFLHKNLSEVIFKDLKDRYWWARLINIVYRLIVVGLIIWIFSELYKDGFEGAELFDFLYAFIAVSTVIIGSVVLFHFLLWTGIYIGYGSKNKKEFSLKNKIGSNILYKESVFWIYLIFSIFVITWIILGS